MTPALAAGSDAPGSTGPRGRLWLVFLVAGWGLVAVLALVDTGYQRLLREGALLGSWHDVVIVLGWLVPGALLSLTFGVALIGFRRRRPPAGVQFLGYAGGALAYWLLWSALQALLVRLGWAPVPWAPGSYGEELYRALPGLAVTSIGMFTILAASLEAALYRTEARWQDVRTTRLEAELERARQAALSAQLNPHFLFNAIHLASGLMDRDAPAARQVLSDLRLLLQETNDLPDQHLVRLEDELRLVERYLRIQRARYGDRLTVHVAIDAALHGIQVPALLLQPLVENAVVHGIGTSRGSGWIRLSGVEQNGRLRLEVMNGGGASRSGTAPIRERIGLGGVRARLSLIYGDRASLTISRPAPDTFHAAIELPRDPAAMATGAQWRGRGHRARPRSAGRE